MSHPFFTPCPNCGGSNVHVAEWYAESGDTEYYGCCDDCGFEDGYHSESAQAAIDHWRHYVSTSEDEEL